MVDRKAQRAFKKFLVDNTGGCTLQDGYPCGTCTIDLLHRLGLDPKESAYHEHNKDHDRINEVWRAILQIREAK